MEIKTDAFGQFIVYAVGDKLFGNRKLAELYARLKGKETLVEHVVYTELEGCTPITDIMAEIAVRQERVQGMSELAHKAVDEYKKQMEKA